MDNVLSIEKAPLQDSLQELAASVQKGYIILRGDCNEFGGSGYGTCGVNLIPSL